MSWYNHGNLKYPLKATPPPRNKALIYKALSRETNG